MSFNVNDSAYTGKSITLWVSILRKTVLFLKSGVELQGPHMLSDGNDLDSVHPGGKGLENTAVGFA